MSTSHDSSDKKLLGRISIAPYVYFFPLEYKKIERKQMIPYPISSFSLLLSPKILIKKIEIVIL